MNYYYYSNHSYQLSYVIIITLLTLHNMKYLQEKRGAACLLSEKSFQIFQKKCQVNQRY